MILGIFFSFVLNFLMRFYMFSSSVFLLFDLICLNHFRSYFHRLRNFADGHQN